MFTTGYTPTLVEFERLQALIVDLSDRNLLRFRSSGSHGSFLVDSVSKLFIRTSDFEDLVLLAALGLKDVYTSVDPDATGRIIKIHRVFRLHGLFVPSEREVMTYIHRRSDRIRALANDLVNDL